MFFLFQCIWAHELTLEVVRRLTGVSSRLINYPRAGITGMGRNYARNDPSRNAPPETDRLASQVPVLPWTHSCVSLELV